MPAARSSRAPTTGVVVAIGLAAVLAAAMVMAVRLTSEFPGEQPVLQAGLLDWIVLSYVFSGLVAWRRRPESRFGPLMIAGGFTTSLASLSSASDALAFTVGQAMDLVPFAVFIHVYLSFPSGRLPGDRNDGSSAPPTSSRWDWSWSAWRSAASARTTCWPSSRSRTWR